MNGNESPTVAVVIPVRNAATTIIEQLDALARQTFAEPFEILVALQRCTDNSGEVIASWTDLPVRIVDASERDGAGFARNVGVAAAGSPLIAFCDADDIVDDNWLSALMLRSEHDVVAGALVAFHGQFDLDVLSTATPESPGIECHFLPTAYSGNMLVRRAAFVGVGGFDVHFHRNHDVDLAWRLQLAGSTIVVADDAIVFYRQRERGSGQWVQSYRWARYEASFFRRYAQYGMPRDPASRVARDWIWIISRTPLIRNSARRTVWLRRSARRSGRLIGSLLERTVFL